MTFRNDRSIKIEEIWFPFRSERERICSTEVLVYVLEAVIENWKLGASSNVQVEEVTGA
jgi:hypothetical protein